MTTTLTTGGHPPLSVLAGTVDGIGECEVCRITGPVAVQQVGEDRDATFLLCARCGAPAVARGMARWLR